MLGQVSQSTKGKTEQLQAPTEQVTPSVRYDEEHGVPTLTIACHPELTRIGQWAAVTDSNRGGVVKLSRAQPLFAPPAGGDGEPLTDSFISRKPITLLFAPDGTVVLRRDQSSTELAVNGAVVGELAELSAAEVAAGAVLTLAKRVVLVLHWRRLRDVQQLPSWGMVGESDAVQTIRDQVVQVADVNVPVLVRGESGSGKELVAQAIHSAAGDPERPFVAVSMATFSPAMAAAELFGHTRGAFTGAVQDNPGLFRRADGGTLLLDEIGDAPLDVQAMLLRVLETGEVSPVGGRSTSRVNVRLVAATDADLEEAVETGSFRPQLYHRLASYQIVVPPLRERREDIGRLLHHLLHLELEAVDKVELLHSTGSTPWLGAKIVERLVTHHWPGNVRQLRNAVRHLVITSRGLSTARLDGTLEKMLSKKPSDDSPSSPAPPPAAEPQAIERLAPGDIADAQLVAALQRNTWSISATAQELGISRTSLYGLIKRSPSIRKAKELGREEIVAALAAADGRIGLAAQQLRVSPRGLQLRMKDLGIER